MNNQNIALLKNGRLQNDGLPRRFIYVKNV